MKTTERTPEQWAELNKAADVGAAIVSAMTTPNQDKATARPWRALPSNPTQVRECGGGAFVADCSFPVAHFRKNNEANAALIVTAVNEHSALLEVERTAIAYRESRRTMKNKVSALHNFESALSTLAAIRGGAK